MQPKASILFYLDTELSLLPGRHYSIGRSDADIVLPHALVSRAHAQIAWEDGCFWLIDLGSTNGTFVNGVRVTRHAMAHGDRIKIGCFDMQFGARAGPRLSDTGDEPTLVPSETIVLERQLSRFVSELEDTAVARHFYELKELYDRKAGRLHDYAYKDPLTGLYNRRFFEEKIGAELERCRRYDRPLHMALVDLDHFKSINDTHGHQKGDDVLRAAAAAVASNCRRSDIAVRFGGEELLLVLPETTAEQALAVAEKIRLAIMQETLHLAGVGASASIGIAGLGEVNASIGQLIEAADRMLYAAKSQGRNRTVMEPPAQPSAL